MNDWEPQCPYVGPEQFFWKEGKDVAQQALFQWLEGPCPRTEGHVDVDLPFTQRRNCPMCWQRLQKAMEAVKE